LVDNVNPTNQFHPYQPMDDIPAALKSPGGLNSVLDKARSVDVGGSAKLVRDWGKAHPGTLLGGLAGAAIGLGLWRR